MCIFELLLPIEVKDFLQTHDGSVCLDRSISYQFSCFMATIFLNVISQLCEIRASAQEGAYYSEVSRHLWKPKVMVESGDDSSGTCCICLVNALLPQCPTNRSSGLGHSIALCVVTGCLLLLFLSKDWLLLSAIPTLSLLPSSSLGH